MSAYADSSFIVSLYITDTHSPDARRRQKAGPPIILTPFHRAEWAHVLAQHQFRGNLSSADARGVDLQLAADIDAGVFVESHFPQEAFELCADLARKHGAGLAMRSLDSLHVACALELNAEQFWTYDERQAKLAKLKGLKTN